MRTLLLLAFALPLQAHAGPVTDACQALVTYFRTQPATAPAPRIALRSAFLSTDTRVAPLLERIASGALTYILTLRESRGEYQELAVKLVNALRYVGVEPQGFTSGSRIDQQALKRIDDALVLAEGLVQSRAARMPYFESVSGGYLRGNLPQKFAAYLYVTFFELVEAGGRGYQNFSQDCLMATLYPKTCSVFVGTSTEMANRCEHLKPPFTVQSPMLFGFYSSELQQRADQRARRDELPELWSFPSTLAFLLGVVHESGHELDSIFSTDSQAMHRYYPRSACGKFMDHGKKGSPFNKSTGVDSDYVSGYASGAINAKREYRPWETFAESLTMYLLAPEYFRALASRSAKLRTQYDYLRTEVIGAEFENPAFKGRRDFQWIDQSTGEFDKHNRVECFVPGEITPTRS